MKVLAVDSDESRLTTIEVQLDRPDQTNEIYVRKTIKLFLRTRQLDQKDKLVRAPQEPQGPPVQSSQQTEHKPASDKEHHQRNDAELSSVVPTSGSQSASGDSKQCEAPVFPEKPTKFSGIISHLEKMFASGAAADSEEERTPAKRRRNADKYDFDDPFINNSQESDHQRHGPNVKTKHSGFFVSAGKLEMQDVEPSDQMKAREKAKSSDKSSSSKIKTLWEPCPEALRIVGEFRLLVQKAMSGEDGQRNTRQLPKSLDAVLREVDNKLRMLHPELVENQTNLEKLLESLPVSKNSLKNAITRTRLDERSINAKNVYLSAYKAFAELVEKHITLQYKYGASMSSSKSTPVGIPMRESSNEYSRGSAPPAPSPLPEPQAQVDHCTEKVVDGSESNDGEAKRLREFNWTKELRITLHNLVELHETWLEAQSKYSKYANHQIMDLKKERIQILNELTTLWPHGVVDVNELRRQLSTEKARLRRQKPFTPRKPTPEPVLPAAGAGRASPAVTSDKTLKRPTSAENVRTFTTQQSLSSDLGAMSDTAPVKRKRTLAHPPKSAEFDDPPEFIESDFRDKEPARRPAIHSGHA